MFKSVFCVSLALLFPAAGLTVNTTVDELNVPAGVNISLREAIRDTPAGGVADFDSSLSGGIIFLLVGSDIEMSKNLTIDGSSLVNPLTVFLSGDQFVIDGSAVGISGLRIGNGNSSTNGGAVHAINGAVVTLTSCEIARNSSNSSGGAIYNNASTVNLIDCIFRQNESETGGGGAVFSTG
ncbi:hypothetical protein N9A86_04875, partial [Akkermansiaceae bacterium]|nr:hypothetical protein [Akkermansiaceae bacterium]